MNPYIILTIGFIIGYAIAKLTTKKSHPQPSGGQPQPSPKEKEVEDRTEKIITYIREKGEVSNNDIQDLFGILCKNLI